MIGEIDGVAPGYKLAVGFWKLELCSDGAVVDVNDSSSNFFYSWNELTVSPWDWLRWVWWLRERGPTRPSSTSNADCS